MPLLTLTSHIKTNQRNASALARRNASQPGCKCKGISKWVHRHCRWLQLRGRAPIVYPPFRCPRPQKVRAWVLEAVCGPCAALVCPSRRPPILLVSKRLNYEVSLMLRRLPNSDLVIVFTTEVHLTFYDRGSNGDGEARILIRASRSKSNI